MTSSSEQGSSSSSNLPKAALQATGGLTAEEAHLVPGASIYVRRHGPAVLQGRLSPQGSPDYFEVLYPDGSKALVVRDDILVANAKSRSPSPAALGSPRMGRSISGGAVHASPTMMDRRHQVEFLGTSFSSPSRQTSSLSAVFSLIATMVGGGVLSLPYAVAKCGWALGFIALLGSALVNAWSFEMLVDCSRRTGRDSYQLVAQTAGGPLARKVTVVSVFLLCWLAVVAYSVLLGDLLTPAIKYIAHTPAHEEPPVRREYLILGAGVLIFPMCVQRSLGALRFLAFASVASICAVTVVLGWEALKPLGHARYIYWLDPSGIEEHVWIRPTYRLWPQSWVDALYAIPMFGVSFLCHFNALPAHQELERPTRFRIRKVIFFTIVGTTVLYGLIGNFGYMFAADETCGNVLLNFSSQDLKALIARSMLAMVMIFNIPLLVLPARDALINIVQSLRCSEPQSSQSQQGTAMTGCDTRSAADNSADSSPHFEVQVVEESGVADFPAPSQPEADAPAASRFVSAYMNVDGTTHHEPFDTFLPKDEYFHQSNDSQEISPCKRAAYSTVVLVSSLGLACFVRSVLVVWGVLGSSVAFLIACILPSAFWLSIAGPSAGRGIRFATACLLCTFITLAVVCTILSLLRLGSPACPGAPASETEVGELAATLAFEAYF